MFDKVELRDIIFENVDIILSLTPEENQRRFVEPVAKTIALAYAGINESCPGFLSAIYYNGEPVGSILVGRSRISKTEPESLHKYEYAYRIIGFFIDKHYQRRGIGRTALKLALEKLNVYPDAKHLPVYIECHHENTAALTLYESCGFQNINVILDDCDCVLVRFPDI